MRSSSPRRARGFSLIEIIITLVVLGIAGAMLVVFMGPGITRSYEPIAALQNDAGLQMVMENMIADVEGGTTLAQLTTNIGTSGSDQTNAYGNNSVPYHVDRNSYCSLDAGTSTFVNSGAVTDYLCVTISCPGQSGSKISYLFTE